MNSICRLFQLTRPILTAALTAPLVWASAVATVRAADEGQRPNVVLILADDVGVDAFSMYGGEDCRTPALEALARDGIMFSHCYSQPLCTPSRVKLLTGRSNIRNYVDFRVLDPNEPMLGKVMQSAGYRTAIAGKWQLWDHVNTPPEKKRGTAPADAGFDTYCLWQVGVLGSRYWGPLIETDGKLHQHPKEVFGPDVYVEHLKMFISENKDQPFFVYYPMALPHAPFVHTPKNPEAANARGKQKFIGMVEYVDALVQRLVDHLEAEGVRDNTLILFTSDNGTSTAIDLSVNGKLRRGGKRSTSDAGTHVPLIANWPAGMPAAVRGSVCNDLVDLSDFLPTLAEAGKADLPETQSVNGEHRRLVYDGVSFLPILKGQSPDRREAIFIHFRRDAPDAPVQFARNQRWKLYGPGLKEGEFYDILHDREEQHPISAGAAGEEGEAARLMLKKKIAAMQTEAPQRCSWISVEARGVKK